jgi:hypothetical protein
MFSVVVHCRLSWRVLESATRADSAENGKDPQYKLPSCTMEYLLSNLMKKPIYFLYGSSNIDPSLEVRDRPPCVKSVARDGRGGVGKQ